MKPFVLLSSRPEDEAAADEYEGFRRACGLKEAGLQMIRVAEGPMPSIDLDSISGIIVGGGPFNASDPLDEKSSVQLRVEAEFHDLLDQIYERDFPFMGACYGIGTLGVHQGGVIDRTYGEPVGSAPISLTDAGMADPVLADLPRTFTAFVGHKEACSTLPPGAVLLASSPACPVQMFRVRTNLYATQFHPELTRSSIIKRIRIYQHAGYFPPEDMDTLIEQVGQVQVDAPPRILANFVERYGR
ncbi:MAG: glutamine amidotransferase [Acidimicrobiales bacterium]|nr:glutamine amidotransferase [Acidimicrobiales bacterium]